jgi:hypothetical protein
MRIDQTTRRAAPCGALLILLASVAPAAPPGDAPSRVVRFLGTPAAAVLKRANRVEVFKLAHKRAGDGQNSVGGYLVLGPAVEQGEPATRRISQLLLDEKSYRFGQSTVGGFTPVVGLRIHDGDRSVDVVLSFATDEVVVSCRNPDDGVVRSAQAAVAPAREALLEFVKKALPELARDEALH